MHRPTVAVLALALLAIGVATQWIWPIENEMVSGSCLRVGAVLGTLWLALPNMNRFPRWQLLGLVLGLFVVFRWPKLILAAVPVALLIWLLGPRGHSQATHPPAKPTEPGAD